MNYYNYFTEIEEHFVKRRGKHLLVSPIDWNLIATWRSTGVPLHVALRGIDIAMDGYLARKNPGSAKVNTLCYCHDAVMEAYSGYLESRVGESPAQCTDPSCEAETGQNAGDEPGQKEILEFIFARINEIKDLCVKQFPENGHEGLRRVVDRLSEIAQPLKDGSKADTEALERDLAILDDLLITELRTWVTEEELQKWETEAKTELKVYKKKLPKETFEKIRNNFFCDKTRRKFHIDELSIFRL
jgi:hypothetical protein